MDNFEKMLREDLAGAAERAPRFTTVRPAPLKPQTQTAPRWTAIAAVACGLVAVGIWFTTSQPDDASPQAQCTSGMTLDGQTYQGHGEGLRIPRPGAKIGQGTVPGCDDGNGASRPRRLQVFTVPGIDPNVAVLAAGQLWLAEQVKSVPESIQAMDRPVPCTGQGPMTVIGQLTSITPSDSGARGSYKMTLVADRGDRLPLDLYSKVTLDLQVTASTTEGYTPELVREAVQGGAPATARVTCDGSQFTTLSIGLLD